MDSIIFCTLLDSCKWKLIWLPINELNHTKHPLFLELIFPILLSNQMTNHLKVDFTWTQLLLSVASHGGELGGATLAQRWIQTFRHSQKNQSSQNKRLLSSNNSLIRHFVEHSVYKVQLVVKVTLKNLRANVLQNFANYELIIEFWSIFTLNMYFSNIYWQYLSLRNIQIVKLAKIKGFIWNSKFSLFFKTPSIYFYSFDKIISRLNPTLL